MRNAAVRSFVVVLSLVAWFALSNHCALGAAVTSVESVSDGNGCPMHSAPGKKDPASKPPCCKEIRAILAKCVTANAAAVRLVNRPDRATEFYSTPAQTVVEIAEVDTGPPGFSFAESVLQESMLSHAPPVS